MAKGRATKQADAAEPRAATATELGDLVRAWAPERSIARRELFPNVARIRLPTNFGATLAKTTTTQLLARQLHDAPLATRLSLPTAFTSRAVLDAVRPATGIAATSKLVASLGVQLSALQETLSERYSAQLPDLSELVTQQLAFSGAWAGQFRLITEAVQSLVEEQRRLDDRTDAFVRRHGWPVPRNLPELSYRRVMDLVGRPKRDVNRLMVELFRPGTRTYRSARRALETSPYFEPRRPLLRQVWRAQNMHQRYLVINGLLPLVEGVLTDVMFPTGTRPHAVKPGVSALAQAEVPIAGPIKAAETLLLGGGAGTALFDRYQPPTGVEPRTLNRHAVLHGIARRYGTEQNATKLFLLLVLMAECFELKDLVERAREREKRRRRQASEERADG